jgi:tripartite-type tricarboxylate transporter receptor subunit TctC
MRRLSTSLFAVAVLVAAGVAEAQNWPDRPVRFILSLGPGSSPDIAARIIAERLSRAWSQQVIVDNRAGGQNVIGSQAAARAAPDGYTYFFATTAAVVTNLYTFKSLPYDPKKDFAPVAFIGLSPFVYAVNPKVQARTIGELITLDKANPGKITMSTDGPRTFSGIICATLNLTAGSKFLLVPYVSATTAIQDGIGGQIDVVVTSTAALTPFLKRGALRPLAVTAAKRVQGLEDVPAMTETFPGFEYVGWYGLFAPTGTPAEVIARVNRDMDTVLRDREVGQKLYDLGLVVDGAGTLASVQAFLDAEHARWSKAIKDVGIVPE